MESGEVSTLVPRFTRNRIAPKGRKMATVQGPYAGISVNEPHGMFTANGVNVGSSLFVCLRTRNQNRKWLWAIFILSINLTGQESDLLSERVDWDVGQQLTE
jgi:hypothetical protein